MIKYSRKRLYFFTLKGAHMIFDYDSEYFNPEHVLECGQIFRFVPYKDGYKIFSADKACYVKTAGNKTIVECDDGDYFYNYFDLGRDYSQIVERAKKQGVPLLSSSAETCKGLRLLNQNREEMIYSFIISQNNNIPRIKGIIGRICEGLGEKREFLGEEYYAFPTTAAMSKAGAEFFKNAGCGYRDAYLAETSARILKEGISRLEDLSFKELRKELLGYKGVGPKVADCIALFGFSKRESFPVDVWLEKVYREDFGGGLSSREKMSEYFTQRFKEDSGYFQQYLFYGKRLKL